MFYRLASSSWSGRREFITHGRSTRSRSLRSTSRVHPLPYHANQDSLHANKHKLQHQTWRPSSKVGQPIFQAQFPSSTLTPEQTPQPTSLKIPAAPSKNHETNSSRPAKLLYSPSYH